MSDKPKVTFESLFVGQPVFLAPMEDVSDPIFRSLCRQVGARTCVTEFVNVDALLSGCGRSRRKIALSPDDQPTAIQIYGANPESLVEAARIAEAAAPAYLDINCGCWVPRIAARGAGAGWLRSPSAMVEMAARIVRSVSLPVTVKTRLGVGTEDEMPIVDLARRLEDAGVRAIALHCRTAKMGYDGVADWTWAGRVQAAVQIPVLVNGDLRSAEDVERALRETGCAGAMVGRAAVVYPWIFREARARLDEGRTLPPPSAQERLEFTRTHLLANVRARGQPKGVQCLRRHLVGYLAGVPGGEALRARMNRCDSLEGTLQLLDEALATLGFSPASNDRCSRPDSSPDISGGTPPLDRRPPPALSP